MEIHSSSLASYPAGTKPSQSAKAIPKKIVELQANDFKKDQGKQNRSSQAVTTPERIEKVLGQVDPVKIANNNKTLNLQTQKALNAYNDTVNQPLNEQRSQLTSIDFYV